MGIVNVTPDSFSDGGQYLDPKQAVDHAMHLVEDGADIIDIGGESTRPYSQGVDTNKELQRTIPVVTAICESVDIFNSLNFDSAICLVSLSCCPNSFLLCLKRF